MSTVGIFYLFAEWVSLLVFGMCVTGVRTGVWELEGRDQWVGVGYGTVWARHCFVFMTPAGTLKICQVDFLWVIPLEV